MFYLARKSQMICRLTATPDGGLAVSGVTAADEGRYQCVAKNVVGIRTSRKATLSIIGGLRGILSKIP